MKKYCKVITVQDPIYGFKDMSESFNFGRMYGSKWTRLFSILSEYVTKVVEATAYKSSHYALAELVDNSIQSGLESNIKDCNVEIIVIQKENKIHKVLILDNAGGWTHSH